MQRLALTIISLYAACTFVGDVLATQTRRDAVSEQASKPTASPNLMASDNVLGSSKNSNISHTALFDERVKYALGADIYSLAKELKTRKSDCEALVHFIQTGVPNHYSNDLHANWAQKGYIVNPLTVKHQPYTGYVLLSKNKDYMREYTGADYGFIHAFIVTGDGRYLSRNGLGPIRIFSSYQDMLLADGFPHGFVDGQGHPTESKLYPRGFVDEKGRSIKYKEGVIPPNAVVGESIMFSLQDMTDGEPPPLTEYQTSIYIHKNTTGD
jgi:hypothetical protein